MLFKSSIAIGLLALLNTVQGTILPIKEEGKGGDVFILDRLPLLFLPSSKIVNRQQRVAQTSNSSCTNTNGFNIGSQSDLDALASCSTVTGNIIINSVSIPSVTIPQGVQHVKGDLRVGQIVSVVSFSASGLQSISGTFELLNLTGLQSLSAPSLTSVGGINFVILPLLQTMTLGITEAGNVRISDTQLSALNGLSLSTVGDLGIDNNRFLRSVEQPKLTEINGALSISANSPSLTVSFPELLTVANASFRNIQSISFDALSNVTSNLGFFTTTLSSISAQNLTSVGSSLSFVNCTSLTNLSFPQLTTIDGTFLIANNSQLQIISGFDKVQTVGGSIDWTGSFNNASLPDIQDVRGGVNVQSSSSSFTCPFPDIQNNGVVKGKGFVCTGKVTNPSSGVNGTNQTADSGSQGNGSNGSTKASAAEKLTTGVTFAVMSIFAAIAMQYLV